jgi:TPR repeat protein
MIWMAAFVVLKIGKRVGKWYRLAAEQGHAKAQYNLGLMYYNGEGVPEDYVIAYMWWD